MMKKIKHLQSPGSFTYNRSNMEHIQAFENKKNSSEILKSKVVDAYGLQKCPKVVHLLSDKDIEIVSQALRTLSNMLRVPQDVVMCLKCNVLGYLESLLIHDDKTIRIHAAQSIRHISANSAGKDRLLKEFKLRKIVLALQDSCESVREDMYNTVINLSSTSLDASQITETDVVSQTIKLIQSEKINKLRVLAFNLLKNCLNDGKDQSVQTAFNSGAVDICCNSLYDSDQNIREAACNTLGTLCYLDCAKKAAIEIGAVKMLCNLLMDPQWQVCAASAGALMVLVNDDEGKKYFVQNGGIGYIGVLLQSSKLKVLINSVQLTTNIAQYPETRKHLLSENITTSLQNLSNDPNELLSRSAKTAIQIILWKP